MGGGAGVAVVAVARQAGQERGNTGKPEGQARPGRDSHRGKANRERDRGRTARKPVTERRYKQARSYGQ